MVAAEKIPLKRSQSQIWDLKFACAWQLIKYWAIAFNIRTPPVEEPWNSLRVSYKNWGFLFKKNMEFFGGWSLNFHEIRQGVNPYSSAVWPNSSGVNPYFLEVFRGDCNLSQSSGVRRKGKSSTRGIRILNVIAHFCRLLHEAVGFIGVTFQSMINAISWEKKTT